MSTSESNEAQTTISNPEDMSLSYEPLFDATEEDNGPCYLPSYSSEKVEVDSLSSTSEGVSSDGSDALSEEGVLEDRQFSEKEDSEISGDKGNSELQESFDGDLHSEEGETAQQRVEGVDRSILIETSSISDKYPETSEIQVESAAENGNAEVHNSYQGHESGRGGVNAIEGLATAIGGNGVLKPDIGQNEDRLKDNCVQGKQHQYEDDNSTAWRKHKKHFFIFSHAGKPIYSRYGDEHKLAGFTATLQAIMSFVNNSGDSIKYIRSGHHQVVFMVKGPIYLVSISSTDEPLRALRRQLDLLHGQLLLILTKSLEKCFLKNAKFDLGSLLGGTQNVFSSLIHSFSWNFASFLCSYTCLRLPHTARQAVGAALQDIADKDILFALVLSDSKVTNIVGADKASLHPTDIFLLSNFVSSSESLRTTESFLPVCLPKYNAMAFLYAYIYYLDKDTCLILITKNADAFFHLKDCKSKVESFLTESHVLHDISNSVARGGLRIDDLPGGDVLYGSLPVSRVMGDAKESHSISSIKQRTGVGGAAGLWHFIYRSAYLNQYIASEFLSPLETPQAQKRLFRAYQSLYVSIHGAPTGPHQMKYRRDENFVLLAWSTADFEFLAAFDPLAEKSSAITVCNRICQWVRDLENELFFLGANPFNW
ncbi:hypothetical protein KP509_05G092100 [Ceratopteris richardii]|uniref:Vacuolar fusion protein MON1 homolog n=1 Tax=Ceratopteris richardii TaxID=49495 RepID=A0A8T2UP21_CERRI|nr:hypothetical protein KP509_05G092100 [Ceratopteris richardii]KAH7437847.1 hypothetical protein KP509_05G092100 [Ceratopteris richardii]KAH7437849.1 hypothetical protein KP509_05G092100 [Ceratopteris richardii]